MALNDPAARRLRRAPVLPHGEDRPELPGLLLRAPRPVHGDGVRNPAPPPAGGRAPGAELGARARAAVWLSVRVPAGARRRCAAQPRSRPRDRLYRGPSVPGGGLGALLSSCRADHARVRGAPPLGQASLPDGRDAGGTVSALARLPAGPRPPRPPGALPKRLRGSCPGPDRLGPEERPAPAPGGGPPGGDPVALHPGQRLGA